MDPHSLRSIDAVSVLGRQPAEDDPSAAALRLLAGLSSLVNQSRDLSALQQGILELACHDLGRTRAFLARIQEGASPQVLARRNFPEDTPIETQISTTVLQWLVTHKAAVLIGDAANKHSGLSERRSVTKNRIRAVACAPVLDGQGRLTALLYVDSPDRAAEFTERDAEFLIWLGQLYGLLAENLEMRRHLADEVERLRLDAAVGEELIVESQAMKKIVAQVRKVAKWRGEPAVLILGETGVGKEEIAKLIHTLSERKGRFIPVNSAALPEGLFEAELFGHAKGAFSNALRDRPGLFREAHHGTLFLDEIGDLDLNMQAKLLRALQEKQVRSVGADREEAIDVRVVCATNRPLQELVQARKFREDLYYRIAGVTLEVPPLRERPEDVLALARRFVHRLSDGELSLGATAEQMLLAHRWPGNVRELMRVMERAVLNSEGGEIGPDDIALGVGTGERIRLPSLSLEEVERQHIIRVLTECHWNQSQAQRELGIARDTLRLKMKKYGIRLPAPPT